MRSPTVLVLELRERGVELASHEGRLRFRPVAAVPDALRSEMRLLGAELIALVERFEERAAIMEHDGGLPREEAERRAWESVLGLTTEAAP